MMEVSDTGILLVKLLFLFAMGIFYILGYITNDIFKHIVILKDGDTRTVLKGQKKNR